MTRPLTAGDAAPWFTAPEIAGNPHFNFASVAGRPVLLVLAGSTSHPLARAAIATALAGAAPFDDDRTALFVVTIDPADVGRLTKAPGVHYFLDADRSISARFGATDPSSGADTRYLPYALLLDERLRVLSTYPLAEIDRAVADLRAQLAAPPAPDMWAPVLEIPRLFEPELCRDLIARYEANGGEESGFMVERDGKTILNLDPLHKRRRDWNVDDRSLRDAIAFRIRTRLANQVERAFQFTPTRMERYIVACYDAADKGHFRAHRDNTTKGTAHRRFAVTINLNADEYDGGDLRFPEFGARTYRAPTGGAVVFSCSLLHEARPVTRGRRYAFLPFLYDDAGAKVREQNNQFLGDGVGEYRAGDKAA